MNLNFFGPRSPYLGHPLLTPERTATEVDVILAELNLESVAGLDVVDVGCGFGRHAIEFAHRGANVVAIDPSSTMIDAAKVRAADASEDLAIEWRTMAGKAMLERDAFDLAICLFTTLGQLQGQLQPGKLQQGDGRSESRALLDTMTTALRPGGHVVIEVPERGRATEMLIESETLGPPGHTTEVTRKFDATTAVLHERFETPGGGSFDLAYELFTSAELVGLCADAGLVDIVTIDRALAPPPPTFVTLFASCPNG